jgi:hypothetical protein
MPTSVTPDTATRVGRVQKARRFVGPLTPEEHSQAQTAIHDALENKKRADLVMAVYHGHTTIDIVAEEADLTVQSVSTVLRMVREKGLKEEPNKLMQVTRFVNHFFKVDCTRRLYTDYEFKEALFAWMAGDLKVEDITQQHGVPQKTLNNGRKTLRGANRIQANIKSRNCGWPSRQALRTAVDNMDMSTRKPGPKSTFYEAESAIIQHRWSSLAELGRGFSKKGQKADLKNLCVAAAESLLEEIQQDKEAGHVDEKKVKNQKKLRCFAK